MWLERFSNSSAVKKTDILIALWLKQAQVPVPMRLTLNIPRGVLRGPPLVYYYLTSVEINKHKIFDTNNA